MNYLIYTLHIEEMEMNKKFNVSLICKVWVMGEEDKNKILYLFFSKSKKYELILLLFLRCSNIIYVKKKLVEEFGL